MFNVGDVVTIEAAVAKDGTKHLGLLKAMHFADGHTVVLQRCRQRRQKLIRLTHIEWLNEGSEMKFRFVACARVTGLAQLWSVLIPRAFGAAQSAPAPAKLRKSPQVMG